MYFDLPNTEDVWPPGTSLVSEADGERVVACHINGLVNNSRAPGFLFA